MSHSTRRRPTRRTTRLLTLATVPIALLGTGFAVTASSYSAFSATTTNPSNSWSAGSVALSDDDSGAAMFSATGLVPGSTGTKCIAVTSTGNVASAVKLYAANYSTTNALGSAINLTVTEGTGGGYSSCTGFTALTTGSNVYSGTLANLAATNTSYATGLTGWSPTGTASETRVFKITYAVSSTAANTVQGGTAAVDFTWEAQNS